MTTRTALLLLPLVLAHGCADFSVKRVRADDYDTEGFRYYLPRPYVSVKKPFPVAGDDVFLWGEVSGDGRVVTLDNPSGLPAYLAHRFANGKLPASVVRRPVGAAESSTPDPSESPDEVTVASTDEKASAVIARIVVSPQVMGSKADEATITVTITKDAKFDDIRDEKVVLLPFVDGKVDAAKGIRLDTKPDPDWVEEKTDGVYKATAKRSNLAEYRSFAVGIEFEGKPKGGDAKTVLEHSPALALTVEPKPTQSNSNSQTPGEDSARSRATLTVSGDPRTDPLQKLGELFDVVYLPDFDQQYAIDQCAGLGVIETSMGFENGWMVEHASTEIDNQKLGEFIYENIQKVVDLGLAAATGGASAAGSAAEDLAEMAKNAEALGAEEAQRTPPRVLLRVRWVAEAQPGLYPMLKTNEWSTGGSPASTPPGYILQPYPPLTTVAYNVRHAYDVTLVDAQPARRRPEAETR